VIDAAGSIARIAVRNAEIARRASAWLRGTERIAMARANARSFT
jgi:hypothetical protein